MLPAEVISSRKLILAEVIRKTQIENTRTANFARCADERVTPLFCDPLIRPDFSSAARIRLRADGPSVSVGRRGEALMITVWRLIRSRTGCTAALLVAAGLIFAARPEARAAGLLVADGGLGGVLEIDEHTARVTINNGIAVTEVTQVFRNTENRQVEALYLFPVPKGASVANFSMWIGGKEMIGEVVEKQRAREIYNSYKQVRRDPGAARAGGLQELRDADLSHSAAGAAESPDHLLPGTRFRPRLGDLRLSAGDGSPAGPQRARPKASSVSRCTSNRKCPSWRSKAPAIKTSSSSSSMPRIIARPAWRRRAADLNRDLVLAYQVSRPRTGIDVVTSKTSGEDGYFLLTMTAGKELEAAQHGMDYVFVLDISGSMMDDGKLQLSRDSIDAFVRELGADDRFELITFNVAPQPLFKELRAVNKESQAQAVEFLRAQQARGGTVLRPAMAAAYRYGNPDRPLNVVILSDGLTEPADQRNF